MWQPGSPESLGLSADGAVPSISFPVLGLVTFGDGWALPRGNHGERPHEGTDISGVNGQPWRAAFDGVVTRRQVESRGIAGVAITITRSDGLRANYFHLNEDNPGTNDGAAPAPWRIPDAVQMGTHVTAGQIIAFMGDSGNAGVPHLHFELRRSDGTPINPYPALVAAERREQCHLSFGPWANVGTTAESPVPPAMTVDGPGGAQWIVSGRGDVVAVNPAASALGRVDAC